MPDPSHAPCSSRAECLTALLSRTHRRGRNLRGTPLIAKAPPNGYRAWQAPTTAWQAARPCCVRRLVPATAHWSAPASRTLPNTLPTRSGASPANSWEEHGSFPAGGRAYSTRSCVAMGRGSRGRQPDVALPQALSSRFCASGVRLFRTSLFMNRLKARIG